MNLLSTLITALVFSSPREGEGGKHRSSGFDFFLLLFYLSMIVTLVKFNMLDVVSLAVWLFITGRCP